MTGLVVDPMADGRRIQDGKLVITGANAGGTPVSRADGADVVMLPTDLSAETGVPPLTNGIEGTAEAGYSRSLQRQAV